MFKMRNKHNESGKDLQQSLIDSQRIVKANSRNSASYEKETEKLNRWERGYKLDNDIDRLCRSQSNLF